MAPSLPRGIRRTLIAAAVTVTLLVLAGATYQGVATSIERHRFLRPGGLVEGGAYQLHIYCVGTGSPTVVLEAAAGSISSSWGAVQPRIARTTRVCSYDRSGLGWSEGDGRYDPARVPGDLRSLLTNVDERGDLVIVGHELGAAFARLYAARDPEHTVALVLVDDPLAGPPAARPSLAVAAWPWLARAGILRATGGLSAQAEGVPGEAGGALRAFLYRPDHLTQAAREIASLDDVSAAARAATLDPSLPITSVNAASTGLPATLTSPRQVEAVVSAIEDTVTRVRQRQESTSPSPK